MGPLRHRRWRPPPPRPAALVLFLAALLPLPVAVLARNWKQVTGTKQQNLVRVRERGWGPRWGAAVCAKDLTETEERQFGRSRLFLLGGDSYDPGTGGGGMHNDVYSSFGEAWRVWESWRRTNSNGDPEPVVSSRAHWDKVVGDLHPPEVDADGRPVSRAQGGAPTRRNRGFLLTRGRATRETCSR